MKVLVTGASGFIGSGVVKSLTADGHEVYALMRKHASENFLKNVSFTRVTGDLRNLESLMQACRGMDAVMHLAGLTAAKSRDEFFAFNADGTKNLAESAALSPSVKRFVYVSSLAAAGPGANESPRVENETETPISSYGESKLKGERYLEALKGKLPYVIIRPPIVYGPRDKNLLVIFKSIQKKFLPVFPAKTNSGFKYYSVIYVDDLVEVLTLALGAPESIFKSGEKFYVGDGKIYTNHRIADLISENLKVIPKKIQMPLFILKILAFCGTIFGSLLGKTFQLNNDKLLELLPDYWTCSSQKANEVLGFKPKFTMESGVPVTSAWYKVQKWL